MEYAEFFGMSFVIFRHFIIQEMRNYKICWYLELL